MNQADKDFLASIRVRARGGEEFNPTLLALYQGLEARDARESGKHHHLLSFAPASVSAYCSFKSHSFNIYDSYDFSHQQFSL